jgi:hypothetical protein
MTIQEFRKMLAAQPFEPFIMHLADGRVLPVPHREFVLVIPNSRTVIVALEKGGFEFVDLLLVVGVEGRAPAAAPAPPT